MIDWHSHVLPGIDDGSRSPNESIGLLSELYSQGVNTVIATPHFYADEQSVDEFIERREKAYDLLSEQLTPDMPKILKGAEVRYYSGISRMEKIECLKIENSKLLLLEMPFAKFGEYALRELEELSARPDIKIILAHFERSASFQEAKTLERIYQSDLFIQANASYFLGFMTKKRAINNLIDSRIHFIGSDCHNLTSRPPKIGKAFDLISKKIGSDFLTQINEFGKNQLVKL